MIHKMGQSTQLRTTVEHDREKRVRVGFLLIGDGKWRGGVNYQRTLLETIAGPLAQRVEARLFVTESQRKLAEEEFGCYLEVPPVVDHRVAGAGAGRRALGAAITGHDGALQALVREHDIDVMFETARFFGHTFAVPILSWLPDFQHRYLPQLFSRSAWLKREIGFRAQSKGPRITMLSSEAARSDCEQFYPRTRGRTQVVRFTPQVAVNEVHARMSGARADHGVPERFFYMPNQFWTHKNHGLVLAALRRLRENGDLSALPPVIMSGTTTDDRNVGYFEKLMGQAEAEGLSPWFRHLGLIPFPDVLALNASALAVLNPSSFEGWASSVEEAKALGTPLILSDIPVHREQAPKARFFDPKDKDTLAEMLCLTSNEQPRIEPDVTSLLMANNKRQSEFANALETAIMETYSFG